MTWLATIGAVATFVGLFGTIMGIVDAFHGLGTSGGATLRAVAPGISEALITTAAGMVVAVPAVMGYNQLTARLREQAARLDDFSRELLNSIEDIHLALPHCRRKSTRVQDREPVRDESQSGENATCRERGRYRVAFTASNGSTQTALSDINITPLVDVVLVLLVIFMITAPVLQSGIEVAVPKTRTVKQITEQRTVVTIDSQQRVYLDDKPVNVNELPSMLQQTAKNAANRVIYVRADQRVPFGAFASVMDAVKQAGITNISIVTQPIDQPFRAISDRSRYNDAIPSRDMGPARAGCRLMVRLACAACGCWARRLLSPRSICTPFMATAGAR